MVLGECIPRVTMGIAGMVPFSHGEFYGEGGFCKIEEETRETEALWNREKPSEKL